MIVDLLLSLISFYVSIMILVGLYFSVHNNFDNLFDWRVIGKLSILCILFMMFFVYTIQYLKAFFKWRKLITKPLENVDEFIAKNNFSVLTKKYELSYLLDKWKNVCENIPYTKKYFIDEYLNDLYIRDILDEIFTHCIVSDEHKEALANCDKLFIKKTVKVKKSLYEGGDEGPIVHWYHYRIPKERIFDWYPKGLKIVE